MNKNEKLLLFSLENKPLGEMFTELKSFSEKRPIGYTDISTWIRGRNYAKHKKHFKKWIAEWGLNTDGGFIDATHCLGINDCLWVKPESSTLKWEDVSLYSNDFTDVARYTAFDTGLFGLQFSPTDITSPEFTSEGTAPKCWKKEENKIYLYKAALDGASNCGLEANSEYIASSIARHVVGDHSISYDLQMMNGKLCSKCELFTNENYGYVPFHRFVENGRRYTIEDIVRISEQMGFGDECREMFFVDSLVFNQDRHLGNFGFIVDNNDFSIKKFAPLFDFNLSMLCNAMEDDIKSVEAFKSYENKYMLGHKLGGKFADVGQALCNSKVKKMLPNNISFPMHPQYNLEKNRINHIIDIIDHNVQQITGKHYYSISRPEEKKAEEIVFGEKYTNPQKLHLSKL